MHRILHTIQRSMDAMVRAPYVTAVAVGTIYVAILITGAFAATLGAGGRLRGGWGGEVYLAPGTDLEAARAAAVAIAPDAQVEAIPPAEAMRRLRASLGEQGRVLDGLSDDALPASVDVREPALSYERARALAARLRTVPGAVEVDDGAVWLARIEGLVERGRQVGFVLLALLGAATAILVSNTLKLAVYARREEIEIMKLVGATNLYVGAPILLEGAIQGLLGAGLAAATLGFSNLLLLPRVRDALPLAARLVPADILPGRLLGALLLGGAVLGLVASAISLQRFLRRTGG
jgi:cell division transport system permease protein